MNETKKLHLVEVRTSRKGNEVDHDKFATFHWFDSNLDSKLIVVNNLRIIQLFIADDLIVVDSATNLGFEEDRVESVNKTLARICSVSFVYKVLRNLTSLSFESQEKSSYVYAVEAARFSLKSLLSLKGNSVIRIVDRVVPVLLVE